MSNEKQPRISGYGQGSITISDLTEEDAEKLEGCIRGGMWWAICKEGKMVFYPNYQALPNPTEDLDMLPFWRKASDLVTDQQPNLLEIDHLYDHSSPSIQITSLCGYAYTPENYKEQAERLESYGFECLRSRRSNDARYIEVWYLPGLWAAKGDLAEYLNEFKGKALCSADECKKAVRFLGERVQFGSLDVCVQRLAMVMDD